MTNYKYQHYLPVGHQKLFSSETDGRYFVCKYDKRKAIVYSNTQNPKNHGGKKHLYSYPDGLIASSEKKTYLERKYFSSDGDFVSAVKKLISGTKADEKDIYQISKYIANTNNRHPENLNNNEKDVTQSALEHMFGHDSELASLFGSLDIVFVPEPEDEFVKVSSLKYMLHSITQNLHELCCINMNILVSDEQEFVLSDAPFVGTSDGLALLSTASIDPDNNYYLPLSMLIFIFPCILNPIEQADHDIY